MYSENEENESKTNEKIEVFIDNIEKELIGGFSLEEQNCILNGIKIRIEKSRISKLDELKKSLEDLK